MDLPELKNDITVLLKASKTCHLMAGIKSVDNPQTVACHLLF
jgi:hypothetical protein